jgi:hypothetical protein
VNHIKGHHEITTKDLLFLNMKAYYDTQKVQSVFDAVPLTIVLNYLKDGVGDQVREFQKIHKIIEKVNSMSK